MRIREFYDRITEQMALGDLWDQFKADAQSSYRLYSEDINWEEMERLPKWRRYLRVTKALLWAMLLYLTPARRLILVVSLILLFLGMASPSQNRPIALGFYGGLGLLLVLALELADRVIMKRDLQIAREIQHWLVPESPPVVEGLGIAFATRPANTVGGDFYDVIVRPSVENPEKLLIAVADVAGKSVPAALLMATFQASLHAILTWNPTLEELAKALNSGACERSNDGRRFTTAFLCEIDLDSKQMRYINAGHNYPILCRSQGSLERLDQGGLPFGILRKTEYEVGQVQLREEDLLLIFTDGVVEAVNASDEEFGDDRLVSMVQSQTSDSAEEILGSMRDQVNQFVGATRQHDDMTWMVIKT
ncbi:MAG: PP2C family protein-serine/threonine phosphatase [Acidobacteriota bacterium]|nr:MAG: PP2C family protein-serine/threonine phosphatase [Acidobacteriota bacterium]